MTWLLLEEIIQESPPVFKLVVCELCQVYAEQVSNIKVKLLVPIVTVLKKISDDKIHK